MTEDRQKIWDEYVAQGGQPHRIVRRMFLDYNRYDEARYIAQWFIDSRVKLNFPILDYGCGVGDYGIHLLRQGANSVDFYDFPRSVNLVRRRLEIESLNDGTVIDADNEKLHLDEYDFVIFGEVLEHLKDPEKVLGEVVKNGSRFIFTSSYPYRSEDPEDSYWQNHDHDDKARLQIPACKKILEDNYDYTKFEGELRLWTRK